MPKLPNIAFVVTCYKSANQANTFISQLLEYPRSHVFVHIDKKATFGPEDIIKDSRVIFTSNRIEVNWGDVSQIESVVLALRDVIASKRNIDYVSLHSEADLAVLPIKDFATYLSEKNMDTFLYCRALPAKGWGHSGGLERIRLYYPKIFLTKVSRHHPVRYMRALYQELYSMGLIRGRHLPPDIKFYGGDGWFTASIDIIKQSIDYLDKYPQFMRIFSNSLIGEEIFYATLFSKVGDPRRIILDNNLRYIDWSVDNPAESGSPRTLLIDDVEKIHRSGKFFARKFSLTDDTSVIEYYLEKTAAKKLLHNKEL